MSRAAVDWAAAGRKAWETRLRNLALGGQVTPASKPPKPPVDWRAAGLKAFATRRARELSDVPLVTIADPAILRQVRRMAASMREFGFDPGGYWEDIHTGESGKAYRVAGDPIHHTIGQVAGEWATRAETIEALDAVAQGRRPELPLRLQALAWAIEMIATALARGEYEVESPITGRNRIVGPEIPDEMFECEYVRHDNDIDDTIPF